MAVAVKNSPVTSTSGPLDRLPVLSVIGVIYVLGCLGVVFGAIPKLWWSVWEGAGLGSSHFAGATLMTIVMFVAAVALIGLGFRLVGPRAVPGVKAGIFVGLVGVLVIVLLTRAASLWIEHWALDLRWFGDSGKTVGAALTAGVGLVLLILGFRLFARPATEKWLVQLENQGWFSATAYKRQQGQKVRRATIVGILAIVGAGIFTLHNHGTLKRGSPNWELNIPFTGEVRIEEPGDLPLAAPEAFNALPALDYYRVVLETDEKTKPELVVSSDGKISEKDGTTKEAEKKKYDATKVPPDEVPQTVLNAIKAKYSKAAVVSAEKFSIHYTDRYTLRNLNDQVSPSKFVMLVRANEAKELEPYQGKLVDKAEYDKAVSRLRESFKERTKDLDSEELKKEREQFDKTEMPKTEQPQPASDKPTTFATIPLLPSVQYTVPILMMAVALWLAWRIVNMPTFADFLIATEAELNKVSWTTRRRLYQDTIVVLVTVILMAIFLFSMDQLWRVVLSWKPIGVLQMREGPAEQDQNVEQKPW
jgi:preprotein translocase SecE subunit